MHCPDPKTCIYGWSAHDHGTSPGGVVDASANAREHYASRWLEFQAGVEPIPMDVPLTRQRILDLLFGAGTAESAHA